MEHKANALIEQEELEDSLKEKTDEIKNLKSRFETELAIFHQKIEF